MAVVNRDCDSIFENVILFVIVMVAPLPYTVLNFGSTDIPYHYYSVIFES